MNRKLMLAVAMTLLVGIGSATSEETEPLTGTSLKDYTDYLLNTFGPDATVKDADISGTKKSGEEFGNSFTSAPPSRVEILGLSWSGAQCGTYTPCPANSTLPARRYCPNTQVANYEVQEDIFLTGPYPVRVSQVLDCQNATDKARLCTTAKNLYCPN